ncbi:MAG TPA: hypothetical protein VGK35_14910, partial [Actinotalea sp.]
HAAGTAPVVVTTPLGTSAGTAFTYIPYVGQTPSRVLTDLVVPPGVVRCVQVSGAAGVPDEATGVFLT